jgi:hypothetical protein
MSSLALMFIILPFTLLGFFYVAALLSYELAPRVSALPGHLRAALAVWVGYSLLVSFSLYTAYSPGAAVAGFLLTFFAVPALFVLTGYVVGRAGGWIDSASEVLDDGDAIGFSLFWSVSVTLAALAVEGPGAIGVALVIALVIPFGCFVLGWSLYAMACAVGVVRSATQRFNSMALRARFWGAVEAAGLVRASEYRAIHDNEEESYQRALVAEHLSRVIEADNLTLTQECYQREVQVDCLCSEIEAVEVECATYQDDVLSQGRRFAGALAGKDLQIDKLRVERDTLTAQLESTDAGLFALYSGDLAHEVDRAVETSARIAAVRVLVSPALPYITPGERFALVRALEG